MPINPASIFSNYLRPPKSIADFDHESQTTQMNALQLQNGLMKQDEYRRGVEGQNALRDAYKQFGADPTANANALYRAGQGEAAQGYIKANADIAKTKAAADKDVLDISTKKRETAIMDIASLESPEHARASIMSHFQKGDIDEQKMQMLLSGLPQNPAEMASWQIKMVRGIMTAKDRVADVRHVEDRAEQRRQFGVTSGQTAANDIMTPDGKGGFMPNAPLIGAKASIAKSGASSVSVNTGQKGYENESKLRNDFKSEPIYKDFADMKTAHAQIKGSIAQGTPIADTATATKIMKLLDPGSVVRESELAIAMAAAGKLDRMQNYVQMQISGHKLTPQQRKDFGSLADELMSAATQQYNAKRSEYEGFGKSYGLNPQVLGPSAPAPKATARTVTRTGKDANGKKVVQYSDGSIEHAD